MTAFSKTFMISYQHSGVIMILACISDIYRTCMEWPRPNFTIASNVGNAVMMGLRDAGKLDVVSSLFETTLYCDRRTDGRTACHSVIQVCLRRSLKISRALTLCRPLLPWASECPDVKNYKWRLNPVWHRILIAVPIWQQRAS